MNKSSSRNLNFKESRRWWECGMFGFGEWTYEGDPKAGCK